MATALDELAATGFDAIGDHEHGLTTELRDGLAAIDGLTVHRFFHDDLPIAGEEVGIVAFEVAAHDAALVAAALSAEHGVGLRDGGFCAHVAIDRLQGGDGTGPSRGLLRASVGVGSRAADITRLVAGLAAIVGDGPRWRYEDVDGRPQPVDDPRPRPRVGRWLSAAVRT